MDNHSIKYPLAGNKLRTSWFSPNPGVVETILETWNLRVKAYIQNNTSVDILLGDEVDPGKSAGIWLKPLEIYEHNSPYILHIYYNGPGGEFIGINEYYFDGSI